MDSGRFAISSSRVAHLLAYSEDLIDEVDVVDAARQQLVDFRQHRAQSRAHETCCGRESYCRTCMNTGSRGRILLRRRGAGDRRHCRERCDADGCDARPDSRSSREFRRRACRLRPGRGPCGSAVGIVPAAAGNHFPGVAWQVAEASGRARRAKPHRRPFCASVAWGVADPCGPITTLHDCAPSAAIQFLGTRSSGCGQRQNKIRRRGGHHQKIFAETHPAASRTSPASGLP